MDYKDKFIKIAYHDDFGGHLLMYDDAISLAVNIDKELEAKDKVIAESIPRGKVEAVRNNYMQFLSDCGNDDSDREIAQNIFDVLEEILTTTDKG